MKGRGVNPAHEHDGPQPYFDNDVARNVTAVASQTAFLRCRVHDLGHKSVSTSISSFHRFFFLFLPSLSRRSVRDIDCLTRPIAPLRHLLTARVNHASAAGRFPDSCSRLVELRVKFQELSKKMASPLSRAQTISGQFSRKTAK